MSLETLARGETIECVDVFEHLLMASRVDSRTWSIEAEPVVFRRRGDMFAIVLDDGETVVFNTRELMRGVLAVVAHPATSSSTERS